jgi:hypothetical protein
MKTFWKWFLGIGLVLVVLAVLVGSAFLMHGFRGESQRVGLQQEGGNGQFEQGPMMRYGNGVEGYGPMMGGGNGYGGRPSMMGGYGFFPFMGCLMLLRGLIPLLLLGLLVFGAYRMGKRNHWHRHQAEMAASPAVVEPVKAPEPAAAASHNCRKCGGIVAEDWRNCPFCGTKQ